MFSQSICLRLSMLLNRAKATQGILRENDTFSLRKNVNIERGAVFFSKVSLRDNSGIGINARIGGQCTIGSDVMMSGLDPE